MQTSASKRQRVDPIAVAVPIRSDIWFADGNIVIQAQDTQFRVYKGPLCNASPVLKTAVEDLGDSKGVEGCPLLHLTDSSTDVACVLRTIFDRWSYPDDEPVPFEVITAFMRLGRKWRMKALYRSALARLCYAFPASREEYVCNRAETRILFRDHISKQREIVVDTIALARELDLPFLLPAAFWLAATRLDYLAKDHTNTISSADRGAILSAVNPLRIAYAKYLYGWLDGNSPDCTTGQECNAKKVKYALEVWKPPGIFLVFTWYSNATKGMCQSCAAAGRKHHSEGGERLWRELPSFFGLPSWDELLAAKNRDF
ncbi:hypothetical protein DFH07DRAFT_333663 [Mycena maculata]|uniref:BTB domain-containing protein n=1 Tax=Mycena maculata TaxID=230809 RepID=A0AAD7HDR2_9AGAR|nr:hypothetical protein DFH07DRAFT_333663 [Mycena maculata]